MNRDGVRNWVYANWFFAGLTAGLFLLALTPLLWGSWDAKLLAIYLQLPVYMVHQVEEHYEDRFRVYVNAAFAGGRDALTHAAVIVINVGGVWGIDLAALYLASLVRPGLGLVAAYLAIVNAVAHIVGAAVTRRYNPGLVSAAFLLLPAGLLGWRVLTRDGACGVAEHAWGLGLAVAVHLAMILYMRVRVRTLSGARS